MMKFSSKPMTKWRLVDSTPQNAKIDKMAVEMMIS